MNCEEVLLAKMAEIDGESNGVSFEDAEAHIADCDNCRREIAELGKLNDIFERHQRVERHVNVWPVVQGRIAARPGTASWRVFGVLAIFLAASKVIGMFFENDGAWLFGLVPLALAAMLFALLRENPFKVNTELMLESHHG